MTPARQWARKHAPAGCQATAVAAFAAGVKAFVEYLKLPGICMFFPDNIGSLAEDFLESKKEVLTAYENPTKSKEIG